VLSSIKFQTGKLIQGGDQPEEEEEGESKYGGGGPEGW